MTEHYGSPFSTGWNYARRTSPQSGGDFLDFGVFVLRRFGPLLDQSPLLLGQSRVEVEHKRVGVGSEFHRSVSESTDTR